ncbi:MAG: hypothetical protein DYG89_34885 [Caldilinea sp. CFX5]|nr:hypothetical protein [Caldilinea sp. CFX5]
MKPQWVLYLLVIVVLVSCVPITPQAAQPGDDKIANAMSAGLRSVTKDATVLDWPSAPDAEPAELRKGTNGWVCRPDDPASPLNDPMCFDASWAALIGTEPNAEREAKQRFGLNYMLQGGAVADNFDPAALTPAAGADWVIDLPHVMVVSSSDLAPDHYSTAHHAGGPYIMFEGTPAEHLMIPVVGAALPSASDPIQNAMSAGPLRIAENATILDWPSTAGGELVELRAGDNGWSCLTDDPATPTNDPMCLDAQWMEWLTALLAGRAPEITAIGIGYMLQGGSVASNSDHTLAAPSAGEEWQIDPPHFMLIAPWDLDPASYPTEPQAGGPYIMFAGTPYEHVMVPVTE